jgi:hypothetical protein
MTGVDGADLPIGSDFVHFLVVRLGGVQGPRTATMLYQVPSPRATRVGPAIAGRVAGRIISPRPAPFGRRAIGIGKPYLLAAVRRAKVGLDLCAANVAPGEVVGAQIDDAGDAIRGKCDDNSCNWRKV